MDYDSLEIKYQSNWGCGFQFWGQILPLRPLRPLEAPNSLWNHLKMTVIGMDSKVEHHKLLPFFVRSSIGPLPFYHSIFSAYLSPTHLHVIGASGVGRGRAGVGHLRPAERLLGGARRRPTSPTADPRMNRQWMPYFNLEFDPRCIMRNSARLRELAPRWKVEFTQPRAYINAHPAADKRLGHRQQLDGILVCLLTAWIKHRLILIRTWLADKSDNRQFHPAKTIYMLSFRPTSTDSPKT